MKVVKVRTLAFVAKVLVCFCSLLSFLSTQLAVSSRFWKKRFQDSEKRSCYIIWPARMPQKFCRKTSTRKHVWRAQANLCLVINSHLIMNDKTRKKQSSSPLDTFSYLLAHLARHRKKIPFSHWHTATNPLLGQDRKDNSLCSILHLCLQCYTDKWGHVDAVTQVETFIRFQRSNKDKQKSLIAGKCRELPHSPIHYIPLMDVYLW